MIRRAHRLLTLMPLLLLPCLASAQAKPEFRLGIVISASGGASSLGSPQRAGIALAEETIAKANLGFTVKFVSYDDGSDPTKAANATRRLIDEDKAHMVICCTTTPSTMAMMEAVTTAKTPAITFAGASSVIEPADQRKYMFKPSATDRMMIQRMFDEVVRRKAQKIAAVLTDDSYGDSGLNLLKGIAPNAGVSLGAIERVARTDTNFTPQALRIRQSQPEVVYIQAYPPASYLMQEALRKVGYSGPIVHSQASANAAFMSLGGAALDGTVITVAPVMVHSQIPATMPGKQALTDFVQRFEERNGAGKADINSALAWDGVQVAVEAFRRVAAAKVDPNDVAATRAAVRDAIESMSGVATTSGLLSFSATDHLGLDRKSALVMAEIRGGRYMLLAP